MSHHERKATVEFRLGNTRSRHPLGMLIARRRRTLETALRMADRWTRAGDEARVSGERMAAYNAVVIPDPAR